LKRALLYKEKKFQNHRNERIDDLYIKKNFSAQRREKISKRKLEPRAGFEPATHGFPSVVRYKAVALAAEPPRHQLAYFNDANSYKNFIGAIRR
jgi:hypothetical protein